MNLDYGATLSRAWRITWNNKILWLFGVLAGLAGGSGRANFNFRGTPGQFPTNPRDLPQQFPRIFGDMDQNVLVAVAIGIVCVIILIAIVLFILGVIGRGGLIGGINLADTQGKVSFGEAWGIGTKKFWTVLLIGLIVAVISLLIGLLSLGLAATICLAPLACLGGLLIAVLGVYTQLAQIAAVTENLSFSDALRRAWQVIQANFAGVIILGLILVVIVSIVGFLLALPIVAIAVPTVLATLGAAASDAQTAANASLIIGGLCLLAYIPVLIVLSGILQSWYTAAWTLAYKQFASHPGAAPVPAAPPAPAM